MAKTQPSAASADVKPETAQPAASADPAKQTPEEQAAAVAEAALGMQRHDYPDGSFVVGCPPFPEKSPKERAAEAAMEAGTKG